jgi:hypothetical protein
MLILLSFTNASYLFPSTPLLAPKALKTHSQSLRLRTVSIVRNSNKLENTTFRNLDLFPSSGEERETHTVLGS